MTLDMFTTHDIAKATINSCGKHELLINSEKASTSLIFEENVERYR